MKRIHKKLKIKWNNIALLIILLVCGYVVIHDLYMLTIYSWTWFGISTFLLAFWIGGEIVEYIIEQFNK